MSDQTGEPGKRLRPAEWALWRQPRAAIRYYLAIEAITAGITGWLALTVPVYPENWAAFGVLAGMSVAQGELSRKTEQTRRLITNAPHVNMTSVWVFAGVLVLPPSLTGLLVMVVYGHLWVRVWRHLDTRPAQLRQRQSYPRSSVFIRGRPNAFFRLLRNVSSFFSMSLCFESPGSAVIAL